MSRRPMGRGLAAALASLLLAGCAYLGATPGPDPTSTWLPPTAPPEALPDKSSTPTEEPTPSLPACYNLYLVEYSQPSTMDQMARLSSVIVVATFDGYGTPIWNTPGNVRPTRDEMQEGAAVIVRPVMLTVESTIRGQGTSLAQTYRSGGEVGCDMMVYAHEVDLVEGSEYVFYLAPTSDATRATASRLALMDAWAVASGSTVHTPSEGTVNLAAIAAVAADTPFEQ